MQDAITSCYRDHCDTCHNFRANNSSTHEMKLRVPLHGCEVSHDGWNDEVTLAMMEFMITGGILYRTAL